MSWSLQGVNLKTADEARTLVSTDTLMPQSIKDFILAGIDGLVATRGENVRISVVSQGHLCAGPGSYDTTSASITVAAAT